MKTSGNSISNRSSNTINQSSLSSPPSQRSNKKKFDQFQESHKNISPSNNMFMTSANTVTVPNVIKKIPSKRPRFILSPSSSSSSNVNQLDMVTDKVNKDNNKQEQDEKKEDDEDDEVGNPDEEEEHEIIINSTRKDATNLLSIDKWKDNVIISSAFGMNLFLEARTVMQYSLYWMSQYSNTTIKQSWWFNELITGILNRPICVGLTSDIGYPSITDRLVSYRYLFSFIGTSLHRVPKVIFDTQQNGAFLYCLEHFEHPSNQCFRYANNAGLRGEVTLNLFNYNHIMEYFFEPSFVVITCFAIFIPYLLHSSIYNIIKPVNENTVKKQGFHQLKNDLYRHYIPDIQRIIQSIEIKKSYGCLNKSNPFYESNLLRLKHDLVQLKQILDDFGNDPLNVKQEILRLWSEKASYCSFLKKERLEYVYNKFCKSS